jgi:pimeloyl-ACP methyl ester carboxylesterase
VLADLYESMYLKPTSLGPARHALSALATLSVPTLSLYSSQGAADAVAGVDWPAGSEVAVWKGVGHYLHLERPAELAALLCEWISSV